VSDIIQAALGRSLDPEEPLSRQIDCIDRMTIANAIETRFGIDLPDEVCEHWTMPSDIVRTVEMVG